MQLTFLGVIITVIDYTTYLEKGIKMNVSLEKDYYLRISDFDRYNRLKSSSILDIFQDIAANHANELGIGFDEMSANETLWVLSKVKFEMQKQPKSYETVHVKTWPLQPDKLICTRNYLITDNSGDIIVKGTSEWVVINSSTRKLVPVLDIFPIKEGFLTDRMFEGKIKKIADFDSDDTVYNVKTTFSDCDINGHVNNTKYANYVMDALELSEDKNIKTFQIDYSQEVISGTELCIHSEINDKDILAKGVGDDGKKKFACHMILA